MLVSCYVMSDSAIPWTTARQAPLSLGADESWTQLSYWMTQQTLSLRWALRKLGKFTSDKCNNIGDKYSIIQSVGRTYLDLIAKKRKFVCSERFLKILQLQLNPYIKKKPGVQSVPRSSGVCHRHAHQVCSEERKARPLWLLAKGKAWYLWKADFRKAHKHDETLHTYKRPFHLHSIFLKTTSSHVCFWRVWISKWLPFEWLRNKSQL